MKCYEVVKATSSDRSPWIDGITLWRRVATARGKTETWENVARRLLAQNKLVACKVCGIRPGVVWISCKEGGEWVREENIWVCARHTTFEKV